VIHHSLTKSGTAKAFSNYHVKSNGWPGIGYHFVIEKDGDVVWCNDLGTRSYHVGNSNIFSVGICVVGDFRTQTPTEEQIESLLTLSKSLMEDLNISSDFIKGHSEMKGYTWKSCPVIDMDDLRDKIKQYIIGGEIPIIIENPGVPELPDNTTYIVKRGDTLWRIAEDYANSSVRELLLLNPGINPRRVPVGTELKIK